ncbi:putative pyridine nucleotide-disulfide oxidoreductase [Daedaleopsis nitida]|nr:putative pyridine nucleotide-disulfide oxidoreductase [Daedaleopsis nitida]
MPEMSKTVCIIGAGPSGLVAAKTLLHASAHAPFRVTIFDSQRRIGGLWPTSPSDSGGHIHPLMVANQSRHTVQFSDLAWEPDTPQFPKAWQVGQYLERYTRRWLSNAEIVLGKKVVRTEKAGAGWDVTVSGDTGEERRSFDYLVLASGFFGQPVVREAIAQGAKAMDVPVVHSSGYRDLRSLLGDGPKKGKKILVVGGQMSGVEIAATIAAQVSSARHTPDAPAVSDPESLNVHHLIQRPVWVFPLYTSPKANLKAPPFLPLDISSYNLSNRPPPLSDKQGHISEEAAQTSHNVFQGILGTNQSEYSSLLGLANDEDRKKQPFMAVSEHYSDFVRDGLINVQKGKLESMDGSTAHTTSGTVEDVAAVVLATGFDASPRLSFLPPDVLSALHHDPSHLDLPIALAFHGTHHPDVPNLGFVGFYRSPYWGIMEMQARFLAMLWSDADKPANFSTALDHDGSIERTLRLRTDERRSQFPMGDYAFIMSEFSTALDLPISPALQAPPLPPLPHNGKPIDFLCPARYISSPHGSEDAARLLASAHETIHKGLTTPLFVARAVFRSLLGTWRLERDLLSRSPGFPSGHFSGTARFLLREPTREARMCVSDPEYARLRSEEWMEEYLYVEDGTLTTESGQSFQATRRYVWRYSERDDEISVWFVKPRDQKRVDYLFHRVEFAMPDGEDAEEDVRGWEARAGHLCVKDYYNVKYRFTFRAVNLERWTVEYAVKGPAKDYTLVGEYRR